MLVSSLVGLLIACIVFGLIYWVILQLPLPAPFAQIARVVMIVIAVIYLIYFLLGLTGAGLHGPLLR